MAYNPSFQFGKPNKEVLDYLSSKKIGEKFAFNWDDVWKEEHLTNFVVAKAMEVDVLTEIYTELQQSLEKGIPFNEFQKNLQPRLEAMGWWGRELVQNPKTGMIQTAQLGSAHRLNVIFRTNRDMAFAAAKWQRIQDNKKEFPYLLYRIGVAKEHRPEHVALDGICLPVDHPFWRSHYPPNGWLCHCYVQQITQRQYDKMKKEGVEAGEPEQEIDPKTQLPTGRVTFKKIPLKTTAPKIEMVDYTNPRTGEKEKIPEDIDYGFDYNVGIARFERLAKILEEKVIAAPPVIAKPIAINCIDAFTKLYLSQVDTSISAQIAISKKMFDIWIAFFKLG